MKKIITSISLLLAYQSLAIDYNVIITKEYNKYNDEIVVSAPEQTIFSSCKEILDSGSSIGDGIYEIIKETVSYNVFCDMTTDDGGWMLVVNGVGGSSNAAALDTTLELESSEITNINSLLSSKYSDEFINMFQPEVYRYKATGINNLSRFFEGHEYQHDATAVSNAKRNVSYEFQDFTGGKLTRSHEYPHHRSGISDGIFNSNDGRGTIPWQQWISAVQYGQAFDQDYSSSLVSSCVGTTINCNMQIWIK